MMNNIEMRYREQSTLKCAIVNNIEMHYSEQYRNELW